MKKTIVLAVVLLALTALVLTGCTGKIVRDYDTQILTFSTTEGDFYYNDFSALTAEWNLSAGHGASASSVFSTNAEGLKINTVNAGYATASQTVYLKPYSDYKIEYVYDVDSIADYDTTDDIDYYAGLYIGFTENPSFNIGEGDKASVITTARSGTDTFYFHTDGTREFNLAINVGNENNPVNAVVYVKSVKLTLVDSATLTQEDKDAYGYYALTSAVYGQATSTNVVYVVLGGVATLVLAYVFYVMRSRTLAFEGVKTENKFYEKIVSSKTAGLLITLGVAALIRLLITLIQTAISGSSSIVSNEYGYDLTREAYMGSLSAKIGTIYLYQYYSAYTTLMPVTMYLSTLAGAIGRALSAMKMSDAHVELAVVCIIKLFNIAADLGTVALIYKIIEKRHGNAAATVLASFYALVPVTFSLSAAWGSYESVAAFFVVLAFYFLLNKKSYIGMAVAYFFAAMTSPSALYVVPAVLFYTAYYIYKSLKDGEYKRIAAPVSAIVGGFVLFYLISLPFVFNEVAAGDAFVAFDKYIATVKGASVYSANAFNFQGLLGHNFAEVGVQSVVATIIFIVFVVVVLGIAYFRTRNRIDLTLIAASSVLALWTFANNMKPASIYIALPLMFVVAALLRETRLYIAFALYSAFAFVNNAYVYMVTGYDANGVLAVSYDTTAIMYVFGAFSLVLAVYFMVVAFDVLVSKRAVDHVVIPVPYLDYVKYVTGKAVGKLKKGASKVGAFVSATGEAIKEVNAERKLKRASRKNDEADDEE